MRSKHIKMPGAGDVSSLTDPVITLTSVSGTNPPQFTVTAANLQVGWYYQLDYTTNGSAPDGTPDATQVFTSGEALGDTLSWGTGPFTGGATVKWRVRYGSTNTGPWSNWSNTLSDVMAPAAPNTITGIKDYYEVKAARLWKDTAGTTPVTADGDAVARWDSEMGVMGSFTQATLANRPLYRVNSGNEYLDFDGTNDNMVSGSTGIATMAQPFYLAIATKLDAGNYHQLCDGRAGSNRAIIQCASAPPDKWQLQAGTNVANQGLDPTLNDAVIAGLFNGASSQPRLDGTPGSVVSIGAQSPIDGLTIGSNNTVNGGFLDGRIYGFVLVAASPSSGDKANLDTWLGALQGRTL